MPRRTGRSGPCRERAAGADLRDWWLSSRAAEVSTQGVARGVADKRHLVGRYGRAQGRSDALLAGGDREHAARDCDPYPRGRVVFESVKQGWYRPGVVHAKLSDILSGLEPEQSDTAAEVREMTVQW